MRLISNTICAAFASTQLYDNGSSSCRSPVAGVNRPEDRRRTVTSPHCRGTDCTGDMQAMRRSAHRTDAAMEKVYG